MVWPSQKPLGTLRSNCNLSHPFWSICTRAVQWMQNSLQIEGNIRIVARSSSSITCVYTCYRAAGSDTFFFTSPALMQVALIAAPCTPTVPLLILIWLVIVVVVYSCMLLLPSLTCTDASPDLCTLCLYCYLYIISRKHSISICGCCHRLQLVPVVFSFSHWCTYFTCAWATCTVWW